MNAIPAPEPLTRHAGPAGPHLPESSPRAITAMSRPQIGRLGEDIAAAHLADLGWHLLERNYRVARGEIDIIALDGPTLVFVEVKTRRSILAGVPQAAVDPQKLRRLRLLAGHYLMEHSPPHRDLRIDVLAVMVADGAPPEIEHVTAVGA